MTSKNVHCNKGKIKETYSITNSISHSILIQESQSSTLIQTVTGIVAAFPHMAYASVDHLSTGGGRFCDKLCSSHYINIVAIYNSLSISLKLV